MSEANAIVLFDGICNLCNGSINFIIDRDKAGKFKFAALQSDAGQNLINKFNLPIEVHKSIVLIQNNHVYIKSTAVLKICRQMNGLWPVLYAFVIFPKFMRDPIYDWVAKNRYQWFGKSDSCRVPTKELENRFV